MSTFTLNTVEVRRALLNVLLVDLLKVLDSEEACVYPLHFQSKQVVQAPSCFIGLCQLLEELEKDLVLHDVLDAVPFVHYLFKKPLLDGDNFVVLHLACHVHKQSVYH